MKNKKRKFWISVVVIGFIIGVLVSQINSFSVDNRIKYIDSKKVSEKNIKNPNYIEYISKEHINYDIDQLGGIYSKYYSKFLQYKTSTGKSITIVAQKEVNDEQMLRAYNLLDFYIKHLSLEDPNALSNKMADAGAILVMPKGADGEGNIPQEALMGQPLYQDETPLTGSSWYINNDYSHRDAAFEEILHMVHDYGIGTKNNPGLNPVLQKEIYAATMNALPKEKQQWGRDGLWGYESKDWLIELSKEGSLEQEYLASVVDSYYGLWSAFEENNKGMWGIYIAKDREAIKTKDPTGYKLVKKILPEYLTMMERLSPDFKGKFFMSYNEKYPYTHKSQYLKNIKLTGSNDIEVIGNAFDNIFVGNTYENTFDGKEGYDIIQIAGDLSNYSIVNKGEYYQIRNNQNENSVIIAKNIEVLRFMDQDYQLK